MSNERINASEVFAQVLEIISTAVAHKFESRLAALEDDVERIVENLDYVQNYEIDEKVREVLADFVKEPEFKNAVVSTVAAKLSPIREVKTNGLGAEMPLTEEF